MDITTYIVSKWSVILSNSLKLSFVLYKNKSPLKFGYKYALQKLGWASTQILLVGEPGSGKSLLAHRTTMLINDTDWEKPGKSEVVENFLFHINTNIYQARVIPGQLNQQSSVGIAQGFNKNLRGVIFVCDWGYTQVRDHIIQQRLRDNGMNTVDEIRTFHLENEFQKFREICRRIIDIQAQNPHPMWLMLAVNKCDLYPDKVDDAQKYYHHEYSNRFSEEIKQLKTQVGNRLKVSTVPLSSYGEDYQFLEIKIPSSLNETSSRNLFKAFLAALGKLDEGLNG